MSPMKKKSLMAYFLIPVLYIGVIILFIFLQFSAKIEFRDKVGNLTISGINSPRTLFGRSEIKELKVSFNDFNFLFNRRNPLIATFKGSYRKKLPIESYHTFTDAAEIQFRDGLSVRFSLSGSMGDRITLEPIASDKMAGLTSLSIPFRIDEGRAERIPGIPLLKLENDLGLFFVSLPVGSDMDLAVSRMVMNTDTAAPVIIFARVESENSEPYLYWFTRDLEHLSPGEYQKQVKPFLDKAYLSWQQQVFSTAEKQEDIEKAAMALFSEALKRGEYRKTLLVFSRQVRPLVLMNPSDTFPFLTSPFLGNLALFLQKLQVQAIEQIREVTDSIKEADFSVLLTPNLIRITLNHGPFSLVEEVIRLADSSDLESEPVPVLLNILDTYLEAASWVSFNETAASRITSIITKRLLPALVRSDKGIFLTTSPEGEVDLLQSIKAGRLLVRAGIITGKPGLSSLGRTMILSALKPADSRGFLPARLLPGEGNGLIPDQESIAPEEIYSLIAETHYTPEEYPLYRQLYPGSWIWTASNITALEIDREKYRFSFSFPEGDAHYLIIQGIQPFKSLKLHGIFWKPDPGYFRYTDGWFYEESSQTLYAKITHRNPEEEILINY